jgi:hypothetical protein
LPSISRPPLSTRTGPLASAGLNSNIGKTPLYCVVLGTALGLQNHSAKFAECKRLQQSLEAN